MEQINNLLKEKIKVKTGKKFYIERLMTVLGRTFWQVQGVTKDWSEEMLADALRFSECYGNIKLRNMKFNEYLADTKK